MVEMTAERAWIGLDRDELSMLNAALNEICNGVHLSDADFATRLGFRRAEVRRLLGQVHDAGVEWVRQHGRPSS